MDEFREFMFSAIYISKQLEDERNKAKYVIHKLYDYYMTHPGALPQEFLDREDRWGLQSTVIDYIAGLTDLYAITIFQKLFVPTSGLVTR
jgi:dGTPase